MALKQLPATSIISSLTMGWMVLYLDLTVSFVAHLLLLLIVPMELLAVVITDMMASILV